MPSHRQPPPESAPPPSHVDWSEVDRLLDGMIGAFGGQREFFAAWKAWTDLAAKSSRPLAGRHDLPRFAIAVLGEASKAVEPDPNEDSRDAKLRREFQAELLQDFDRDLEAAFARFFTDCPNVAVEAARRLGWRVIPPRGASGTQADGDGNG